MHVLIDLCITSLQGPLFCTHFCVYSQILFVWFILCINLWYDYLLVYINALKFSSAFHFNFKSLAIFNISFNTMLSKHFNLPVVLSNPSIQVWVCNNTHTRSTEPLVSPKPITEALICVFVCLSTQEQQGKEKYG